MTLAADNAAPSTLADVIGQVVDAFASMGNATPIMVGGEYLERGAGVAPRVLFVPETGGKVGPGRELGRAASISHGCEVYIKGEELADDLARLRATYALGDLVISCIQTAAPGRIEWAQYVDNEPTSAAGELKLSFSYTRDVAHNVARWSLPAASADVSPKQVGLPPGVPGQVTSVAVTTEPEE